MKWKKVLRYSLLMIAIVVTALGIWQWDNIKVVYKVLTTDKETISSKLEDDRAAHQKELEEQNQIEITVQRPSAEQNEALINGQMTADQIKEDLGLFNKEIENTDSLGNTGNEPSVPDTPETTDKPPESTAPPETPVTPPATEPSNSAPTPKDETPAVPPQTTQPPVADTPKPTAQELVNRCVSEMYVYEIELMEQLGVMKTEMLDTWKALQPEERTQTRKMEIGMAGLRRCYELEKTVDADVQAILDRYEAELTAIGADVAVLDTLWDQYCAEKETQKAYYLNLYLD